MTTREYLKARAIKLNRRAWPIVLVVSATAIWGRQSTLLSGLVLVSIGALFAAYIGYMRRTPCLRCSAPLRNVALNWGSNRRPAPRCSHCALDIDEQVFDLQK
jgi:hypothetical protein